MLKKLKYNYSMISFLIPNLNIYLPGTFNEVIKFGGVALFEVIADGENIGIAFLGELLAVITLIEDVLAVINLIEEVRENSGKSSWDFEAASSFS